MSKLLKFSGFVSVVEAREYLSKAIGENVSLAEIYQLVLNRDLVISARFDADECALLGKYIPYTPEQYSELLKKHQVPDEWNWIDVNYIYFDENQAQYYAFNPSSKNITGCWDFMMLGSEVTVIDHYYRIQATNSVNGGLFGVDLQIPRADILLTSGEEVARLQPENQSKNNIIFDYFLNKLVFKKHELNRFVQSVNAEPVVALAEKPLSGKERYTLFYIINALLKESGISPEDKGVASAIRLMTETAGTPISENTIRKILKQISNVTI